MTETPAMSMVIDLAAVVAAYGVREETLASRTALPIETIRLGMSETGDPSVGARIRGVLKDIHRESRLAIEKKNNVELCTAVLDKYHDQLPPIPIHELPKSPIYRQPYRDPMTEHPAFEKATDWDEWATSIAGRVNAAYNKRPLLSGEHVTLLTGSPGTGKTTELKRLLLKIQENATCVFVPLAIYNDFPDVDLFTAASLYYGKIGLLLDMDFGHFLRLEIQSKRLVFFLDSLDEADAPFRDRIVRRVEALGPSADDGERVVPVIISSRYIPQRHDLCGDTTEQYYLAGLHPRQSVEYVKRLSVYLRDCGAPQTLLLSIDRYCEDQSDKMDSFEKKGYLDDLNIDGGRRNREVRAFVMMTKPLFLHLHIAMCLRSGVAEWSIKSVIARYVDFLLGTWASSRTEYPTHPENDVHLIKTLSYIAFELTLRDFKGLGKPTLHEVEDLLREYYRHEHFGRMSSGQLDEFVHNQLESAYTTEIIECDSSTHVRFCQPANVLCDYHLSQFIERSAPLINEPEESSEGLLPAIQQASYSAFLREPHLRFLETGMVLYFQSLLESTTPSRIRSLFKRAMNTPPIDPDTYGLSTEELKQILPLNLMFFGRVFEDDFTRQYAELSDQVHRELSWIYDDTNFATVFSELRPIMRSHTAIAETELSITRLKPDEPTDIKTMDRLWRHLPSADLLVALANQISPVAALDWQRLTTRQTIVLRRIAYQMRYHARTFNGATLQWLTDLHKCCRDEPIADTIINTQAYLRPASQVRSLDWSYFARAEQAYVDKLNTSRRVIDEAFATRVADVPAFIQQIVTDHNVFPFHALQQSRVRLIDLLATMNDGVSAVTVLAPFLDMIPQLDHVTDTTLRADRLIQCGKALLLLQFIASKYDGVQVLLPPQYRLEGASDPNIDGRYDPDDILRKLFAFAKAHLQDAGDQLSAVGGLQLYDFAIAALWSILWKSPYSQGMTEKM